MIEGQSELAKKGSVMDKKFLEMGCSPCRSCGAPILWRKTTQGKHIPCDPKLFMIVTEDGEIVHGWETHFASCPQAKEWSKKGKVVHPDDWSESVWDHRDEEDKYQDLMNEEKK